MRFTCPPDCGHCCTHLRRPLPPDEAAAEREFQDALRDLGVYSCGDEPHVGLALSPAEARPLREEAKHRGLSADLHPRTFLLDGRARKAFVLDYHLAHEECPFYADYKCTVYEHRPLVCRAYPVLAPAPSWRLAPECPLVDDAERERRAGTVRFGAFLGTEGRARRAVEARLADVDARVNALMDAQPGRFARGLSPEVARARLARYRVVDLDASAPVP